MPELRDDAKAKGKARPGELRNLRIREVSFCRAGMNQHAKIALFKADDDDPPAPENPNPQEKPMDFEELVAKAMAEDKGLLRTEALTQVAHANPDALKAYQAGSGAGTGGAATFAERVEEIRKAGNVSHEVASSIAARRHPDALVIEKARQREESPFDRKVREIMAVDGTLKRTEALALAAKRYPRLLADYRAA